MHFIWRHRHIKIKFFFSAAFLFVDETKKFKKKIPQKWFKSVKYFIKLLSDLIRKIRYYLFQTQSFEYWLKAQKHQYFNRISKIHLFFFHRWAYEIYFIYRNIFVCSMRHHVFNDTWNLFRFERKLNRDEYIASARKILFNNTDFASGYCDIYTFWGWRNENEFIDKKKKKSVVGELKWEKNTIKMVVV